MNDSENRPLFRGVNSMHVGLLGVLGLFFAVQEGKLAYGLYTGSEEMSLPSAVALLVLMGLMALGSILLALYMWRIYRREQSAPDPEGESPSVNP